MTREKAQGWWKEVEACSDGDIHRIMKLGEKMKIKIRKFKKIKK